MSDPAQFEIEVKRFYVPGVEAPCPTCGRLCKRDYLSHPTANRPERVTFYCGACDDADRACEFDRTVTVHVRAEVGPP